MVPEDAPPRDCADATAHDGDTPDSGDGEKQERAGEGQGPSHGHGYPRRRKLQRRETTGEYDAKRHGSAHAGGRAKADAGQHHG